MRLLSASPNERLWRHGSKALTAAKSAGESSIRIFKELIVRRNSIIAVLLGLTVLSMRNAPAQISDGDPDANSNVLPITIDAGLLKSSVNRPFVNVTVCKPDSASDCQTIDHVLVDTGSVGLRIFSSPLTSSFPQQNLDNGAALAECVWFADGYAWGPVKLADVQLAGERARSIPIQVIGDPAFPSPAGCPSTTGAILLSSSTDGAKGILGVGLSLQDCGRFCDRTQPGFDSRVGGYYGCSSTCQPASPPLAKQVQHPVAAFAVNNNGIAITLPAIPPGGAPTVTGSLVFGIGTQANNALGSATVLGTPATKFGDPPSTRFATVYKGKTYRSSIINSGSNANQFLDEQIPLCSVPQEYCPPSPLALSATVQGLNGTAKPVGFRVDNADKLLVPGGNPATDGLGNRVDDPNLFEWGVPFLYGKTVFIAIEGKSTPAGTGPYFAF